MKNDSLKTNVDGGISEYNKMERIQVDKPIIFPYLDLKYMERC